MAIKVIGTYSIIILLMSCKGEKNNIDPVGNFDANRYLGKWYEIARLPNRFQRDLVDCTAQYTKVSDKKIRVVNSGYHIKKEKRRSATGSARFISSPDRGLLKVSFFWPFSGLYKIIELGSNYEYAVVVSSGYDYLWILSRSPAMPKDSLEYIFGNIRAAGFSVEGLILNSPSNKQNSVVSG